MKSNHINKHGAEFALNNHKPPDLQQQFNVDITMRARGGIFIYLAVWLITAIWADIFQTNPFAFQLNTALIFMIAIMRIVHYLWSMNFESNARKMHNFLVFLVLLGALHWGVLSAWIIFGSAINSLYYVYMIILAAFVIGGTAILSISLIISIMYPLLICIPMVITSLIIGGSENYVLFSTVNICTTLRL